MDKELYKKLIIPLRSKMVEGEKDVIKNSMTPLITNFERWSGKKIKIKRDQFEPIKLRDNIFARILASPVRFDRISKTRLPSLLLNQIGLDLKNEKINMGQLKHSKDKHSYILNSLHLIEKNVKAPASIVPLHVLTSNKINISTLKVDISELLKSYKEEVLESLTKQLMELKSTTKGDIRLLYDTNDVKRTVFWKEESSGDNLLCFNLSLMNNYELLHKVWKDDSITIVSKENLELLIQIYRVLKFLE